jgi:hypothetical protein
MKRLALAISVFLLAAAPAAEATAAAVKLRGGTSQGFPFAAQFVDGRLDRLHFRWRARCNRDAVFRAYTTWLDGPERVIEQDGETFSDSGTVRNRKPRQRMTIVRRERIAGTIDGTRSIKGKHVTTVRVRQRGRLVYTCRSSVRFSATR